MSDTSNTSVVGAAPAAAAARTPCACGSGLHADHCCAQDQPALTPVEQCSSVQAGLLKAAFEAFHTGKVEAAETTCVALLEDEPGLVPALHMLADIREQERAFTAEIALRRRIVAGLPNDVAHLVRFVTALIKNGDKNEAVTFARKAIWMLPNDPRANWIMALAFAQVHDVGAAEYHFDRALALAEAVRPELLIQCAQEFQSQGKLDKARSVLDRLAADDRAGFSAELVAASIEESAGNLDRSDEITNRLIQSAPRSPAMNMVRARVALERRDPAGALEMVESCGPQAMDILPGLRMLRGRILGELGRYDDAFADFTAGKALVLEQARLTFDPDRYEQAITLMRQVATPDWMARLPRAPTRHDAMQPLFVTGFPRSGTTMVEQTLSMHPVIAAGGELSAMNEALSNAPGLLKSRLPYPAALSELLVADRRHGLNMLRDDYLHSALPLIEPKPGARWFTDKSLMNEGRLPSLALMFPASPIINVVRHPLDCVLSVFSQILPDVSGYSMKLENAARYFRANAEAAEQYRQTLPNIRYLRVRYEDILADQEGEVRRMLAFVGEPYDPACLSFQDNKRHAPTLSYAQVRSGISQSRKYRYKPYLRHLAPVIPILAPVIEMLGYTIEAG